jgi:hypothetical protein
LQRGRYRERRSTSRYKHSTVCIPSAGRIIVHLADNFKIQSEETFPWPLPPHTPEARVIVSAIARSPLLLKRRMFTRGRPSLALFQKQWQLVALMAHAPHTLLSLSLSLSLSHARIPYRAAHFLYFPFCPFPTLVLYRRAATFRRASQLLSIVLSLLRRASAPFALPPRPFARPSAPSRMDARHQRMYG